MSLPPCLFSNLLRCIEDQSLLYLGATCRHHRNLVETARSEGEHVPEYNTIVAGHRETGLWEVAQEQTSLWRLFTLGELRYLPRLTILILNTVVFKSRSALRTFLQRATQVHEPGGHLFFATVGLDGQVQHAVGQVPEPGPWLYLEASLSLPLGQSPLPSWRTTLPLRLAIAVALAHPEKHRSIRFRLSGPDVTDCRFEPTYAVTCGSALDPAFRIGFGTRTPEWECYVLWRSKLGRAVQMRKPVPLFFSVTETGPGGS